MEEGFVLMVIGMAVVFAFLILMVQAVNLTAKFFPSVEDAPEDAAVVPSADDGVEVAVALAAIKAKG